MPASVPLDPSVREIVAPLARDAARGALELTYGGQCLEAHIERRLHEPTEKPQLVWLLRQFHPHRRMQHDTPSGRVVVFGAAPNEDAQCITGVVAVEGPADGGSEWWSEADRLLEHVVRTMSLACGTYLRPYVERRLEGVAERLCVYRQSDAADPFLPPFRSVHLEPIFARACDSFDTRYEELRALDTALHWLLAPAHYDEFGLLTAMTALESIVDSDPDVKATFMSGSAFKKVAKAIRACLADLAAPDTMVSKVPELNRLSFAEKLVAYVRVRGVTIDDLPAGALEAIIKARNSVVHRGFYDREKSEDRKRVWHHAVVARELVIRIILAAIGFEGAYFSQFHGDEQIAFPSCRRLSE